MSMLDAWMKQTHGTKEKMLENEQKFLDKQEEYKNYLKQIRQEEAIAFSERQSISLADHLGYKRLDLKPSKEGQASYFKNYDFSREKSLRSFRFEDGIEMGDMGSEDCK